MLLLQLCSMKLEPNSAKNQSELDSRYLPSVSARATKPSDKFSNPGSQLITSKDTGLAGNEPPDTTERVQSQRLRSQPSTGEEYWSPNSGSQPTAADKYRAPSIGSQQSATDNLWSPSLSSPPFSVDTLPSVLNSQPSDRAHHQPPTTSSQPTVAVNQRVPSLSSQPSSTDNDPSLSSLRAPLPGADTGHNHNVKPTPTGNFGVGELPLPVFSLESAGVMPTGSIDHSVKLSTAERAEKVIKVGVVCFTACTNA